jgi:hypothetical protein
LLFYENRSVTVALTDHAPGFGTTRLVELLLDTNGNGPGLSGSHRPGPSRLFRGEFLVASSQASSLLHPEARHLAVDQ